MSEYICQSESLIILEIIAFNPIESGISQATLAMMYMTCHEATSRIGKAIRYLDNLDYTAESYEEEQSEEQSSDCISIFGPCFEESKQTPRKSHEYVPSFSIYDGIPVLANLPRGFLWNTYDFIIQSACQGTSPILYMERFLSLASNYYLTGEDIILDLARFLDTYFYDWKNHCCTCRPDYRCMCGMVQGTLEAECTVRDVAEKIAEYHEKSQDVPAGFKWISNNATQLLSDYSYDLQWNIFVCLPHVQPYIDMSYDYYCDLVVCGEIGIVTSRSSEWPQDSTVLHQAIYNGILLGFDPYEHSDFNQNVHNMHAKYISQGDDLGTILKQFTHEEARNMFTGDDMRAKHLLEYTGIGIGCLDDYEWIFRNKCTCDWLCECDASCMCVCTCAHTCGSECLLPCECDECIDRDTLKAIKKLIKSKMMDHQTLHICRFSSLMKSKKIFEYFRDDFAPYYSICPYAGHDDEYFNNDE